MSCPLCCPVSRCLGYPVRSQQPGPESVATKAAENIKRLSRNIAAFCCGCEAGLAVGLLLLIPRLFHLFFCLPPLQFCSLRLYLLQFQSIQPLLFPAQSSVLHRIAIAPLSCLLLSFLFLCTLFELL